jgi:hypothetical protein
MHIVTTNVKIDVKQFVSSFEQISIPKDQLEDAIWINKPRYSVVINIHLYRYAFLLTKFLSYE